MLIKRYLIFCILLSVLFNYNTLMVIEKSCFFVKKKRREKFFEQCIVKIFILIKYFSMRFENNVFTTIVKVNWFFGGNFFFNYHQSLKSSPPLLGRSRWTRAKSRGRPAIFNFFFSLWFIF